MELKDDLLKGANAAARYLGLPVRAIYHMSETGEIPVIRKGSLLFYRKSELDKSFAFDGIIPSPKHRAPSQDPTSVERAKRVDDDKATLAEILPLIMRVQQDERATAVMGRLKNLIRVGACEQVRVGRGQAMRLGKDEIWELLCLTVLGNLGVSPAKAVAYWQESPSPYPGGFEAPLHWTISGPLHSTIQLDLNLLYQAAREAFPSIFPSLGGDLPELQGKFLRIVAPPLGSI